MPKKRIDLGKITPTREQWMIARSLSGCIMALNAPFCTPDLIQEEEVNADSSYIPMVAAHIADFCDRDTVAIEDAIHVLEQAVKISEHGKLTCLNKKYMAGKEEIC